MRIPPAEIALASILLSLGVVLIAYGLMALRDPTEPAQPAQPAPTSEEETENQMSDDEAQRELTSGGEGQQQNQLRVQTV